MDLRGSGVSGHIPAAAAHHPVSAACRISLHALVKERHKDDSAQPLSCALRTLIFCKGGHSGPHSQKNPSYAVVQHGNMHCNFPRQAARTDYAFCDSRRSLHSPVLQKKRQKACPKRERKAENQEKRFATFVTKSFTDMANRMIPKNLRSTNITPLPRNLSISSSLESTT